MADVEATVDINVEGAGSLRDAAEAARDLAAALKDADASAGSISGAFGSAAEAAGKLRNDAEEAAKALKSIRDAGLGVGDVAAGAEAAAKGLASMRDDAAEAEAAVQSLATTGDDIADIAPAADADATALGHLRDEALEAEAALDSLGTSGAGLAGDAASADALASSLGHVRDEAAEAAAAVTAMDAAGAGGGAAKASGIAATADEISEANERFSALSGELREFDQAAGGADISTSGLHNDLEDLGQSLGEIDARGGTAASTLEDVHQRMDSLSDGLDDAESRLGQFGGTVPRVVDGLHNFAGQYDEISDSLDKGAPAVEHAGADLDGLRKSIDGMASSPGINFLSGSGSGWLSTLLGKTPDIALGTAADIENISKSMEDAGGEASSFGDSLSSAFGPITSKLSPMSGAIAGLVGLVGGLGPAFGTAFAGGGVALGGFAALALPTLSKIETSYENVATARKTWTQAEQVAKVDPTKTNLEEAATDAAKLKVAYQDVPATIRPVIQAFGNLKTQYDSMAKSFQPEVLKVTGDALSAVSEGISQFLKPAANLGGSLLDKGIKNLQTFMESGGAVKTFNDLLKETPGAVKSAGSAISSVGKFIGDAFGGVGVKGSESFIKSFDGLLKAIGPGAGTAVKGLAGALKDVMSDATLAAPQIGKMASSLGALEKVNLSGLKGQIQSILDMGNKAGGGNASGGKGGLLGGLLGDVKQFEGDWNVTFPKSWDVGGKLGNAAKQALTQIIPGLGSSLKPQTLHLPINVDPKVDVKGGHIDTGALAHQLSGGSALPLPVKVEPKIDPGAMVKSLNLGGPKVPVPAEAKVDKADTSGLKGGDTKVPATAQVDKVDTSGINKAASNVKIHGVTVDLSDAKLSGLTALTSSLNSAGSSAGRSFDTGLASGINGGAGQPEAAAQHVVAEIKSALSSLGGAGSAAGAALGQGLAAGIAASTGAAVAAARTMANEVTAAVKAAHGTQSPSKVFKGIAQDDVKGYILGLEGGKSQLATAAKDAAKGITAPFTDKTITDTITKLQTDLKDALKAGTISPSQETGISAWLDADNKRLMSLAKQRKDIESKITAADALYKSVDQATVAGANVATFAGNVTSGASSGSSSDGSSSSGTSSSPYGSAGTPLDLAQQNAQAVAMANQMTGNTMNIKAPASLTASDSIQGQLQQYLSQTRAFTGDIKKLKSEGLDSTSLQQLLQAGVSGGGLSSSKMLLSGGSKGVQEVASLQKQIAAAAKNLGTVGANAAYESGSQIDGGLAAGLKSELGSVTAAIKSMASQIVDELQKELKIKSPSQVTFDIGAQFAAGMAGGITSGGPMVGAAAKELAIVASRGASGYGGGSTAHPMPIVAGGGSGGGGGSQTMHFHLEVGGQEIAQVVQTYTLQHARRNTGSGLQLSGRGT
jgi:hypothetical protein